MKLILTGGGDFPLSKKCDKLFTENLLNKRILYIPIAIDKVKHPHSECIKWIKKGLSEYGNFEVTLGDEKFLANISFVELSKFGGVFISGGNTFYLLSFLKESGFWSKLQKLLKDTEIPVEGGSAGAVIFTKTIEHVILYDPNDVNLNDFTGMNLVKGKNIWCHYEPSMKKLAQKYADKFGTEMICLPENCGLFVNDGNTNIIGSGCVELLPDKSI